MVALLINKPDGLLTPGARSHASTAARAGPATQPTWAPRNRGAPGRCCFPSVLVACPLHPPATTVPWVLA